VLLPVCTAPSFYQVDNAGETVNFAGRTLAVAVKVVASVCVPADADVDDTRRG